MTIRDALLAAAAAAALAAPALPRACGPDFPPELLSRRAEALATLPGGAFAQEVARLVPPPPGRWAVVEGEAGLEPEGARDGAGARERALYARGARAFEAGRLDEAERAFAAVLALPAAERRRLSTYAAFMLGRCGTDGGRGFAEARRLAAEGFDDPAGLAVASLGEEARRKLDPGPYAPAGEEPPPRDDAGAVRLYAQQAALGSGRGALSLLFVARALVDDPARLDAALADPLVQRLVTTYAWTRGPDAWSFEPPRYPVEPLLERLAAVPGLAGGDRLAAAAWSAGRFDLAERFAGAEATPLSAWVRAKLALRAGDRARADALLAEAEAGTPAGALWTGWEWRWPLSPRGRLEGERCILALARGDRAAAFQRALASGAWLDLAYVAERVLSTDELKGAVDGGARPAAAPGAGAPADEDRADSWSPADPARALRDLLARRLMRDGRRAEALGYYAKPEVAAQARAYAGALEEAGRASGADRAERLLEAAWLARGAGLEIMGTELGPDWGWAGGSYDLGALGGEDGRDREAPSPLRTEAERQRAAAHGPGHDLRFHYRAVAADLAEQAAALVPPRSQAYAALLCQAARFVRDADPARVERLWREYVRRGALVPFAATFGEACPAPDLERVRHPSARKPAPLHLPRKRTLALWGLGALVAAALAGAGIRRAARCAAAKGRGLGPGRPPA